MFVLSALVYPCVLAILCTGAGLLVDRASGSLLPGLLLPTVGAAALIASSQLTTFTIVAAPATPYAMAAVAAGGFALGWPRVEAFAHGWREHRLELAVGMLAYVIALAPVLLTGRPTFSSFGVLSDSAFHMMGADFLMRHGQDYAHLDLRSSYGQYIDGYYDTGYPSGSDTLFGGSAFLMGAPLIWTFQPFNAFMLAIATGPAWVLVRRMGLAGGWAGLAVLSITVPALVYGYELVASVKEIVALAMILTLGALVVLHARWLYERSAGVVAPFAIVLAGGISALGVGFGAWALAAVVVLGFLARREVIAGRRRPRQLLMPMATGIAVVLLSALSTWVDLPASLHVARVIASTSNPGNLSAPLRPAQVLGTWLVGSYAQIPTGGYLVLSYAIAALTLGAAVLGGLRIAYMRDHALTGWIALTLVVWLGLSVYATTWGNAKAIVLSSPVVVLLAWGGIATLRTGTRAALKPAATLLALLLAGGIAVSDAMQYHSSNLAPTARYEELASLDARFAGQGPTLFTDFDEYALYELRDLDVGGLDFTYPPAGIRLAPGHGYPVDLDRVKPAALLPYPLIVTRRDPTASRPPSAYRLAWQGSYYQVWRRRRGAPAAILHLGLSPEQAVRCPRVRRLASIATFRHAHLVAARPPELVTVDVKNAEHPTWTYTHPGLVMSRAGELGATFELPRTGVWDLWLRGELMPTVGVSVDGRLLASIGGQLSGNPHNPNTMTPLRVALYAGRHRLVIARGSSALAPGEGGWAILHEAFLTPAHASNADRLVVSSPARWRSLCGRRFDWIEIVR